MNTSNEIFLYPKTIKKDYDYNMWFFFPGPESFAMSSLGYLWLFREIDLTEGVNIERVYADTKTTRIMRDKINLIGMSFTFDMDFLEIFKFLEWNKLELKAKDRKDADPLIFAGGPVITSNPEPYKEIFDFFVIGDGEGVNTRHQQPQYLNNSTRTAGASPDGVLCHQSLQDLTSDTRTAGCSAARGNMLPAASQLDQSTRTAGSSPDGVLCHQSLQDLTSDTRTAGINVEVVNICKAMKDKPKQEILRELSKLEGVYVPSLEQKSVKKLTKKLTQCIYTPIISDKAFFPNTFILEVERGCANRCGFCLASYMNLPIRFVEYEQILESIELGLKHTNKIALLGAQITAHPKFKDICRYIENRMNDGEEIEMSVSSLRVDSFIPEIVNTLVKAGQKNLTLAIEAGSERLRKVINKNLTEEQIFKAIDVARECGLKGIKFYGMLGLPTETQTDIEEIVNLSRRIKEKYKGFDISFGFSTFVPKANTPFQWFGREDEKSLETKTKYLKKELHKLGIQISVSSAKWDYYQALLSRGDSNLTDYLIEVYKLGGKLGAFKKAAKELKINTDYYATETYAYDKNLPWDFIDIRPGKKFLVEESQRLINY